MLWGASCRFAVLPTQTVRQQMTVVTLVTGMIGGRPVFVLSPLAYASLAMGDAFYPGSPWALLFVGDVLFE